MSGLLKDKSNRAQVFWLGLGRLSSLALAFISAAILSRFLSKEEYGTYKQIMYLYTSLSLIFAAGLPETLTYFLPKLNKPEQKYLVVQFEILLFLLGVVFSLCLYFGASFIADWLGNPALIESLQIYAPVPLLLLPTFVIENIYTCEQKSYYQAIYVVFSRITVLCGTILPVILYKATCQVALHGLVISSFCMLLVALFLIYKPYRDYKGVKPKTLSFCDIACYAFPLVCADFSLMLFNSADQFFVSRYFGEVVFAEFSNGFIQFPLATMLSGSIAMVLIPLFSRARTAEAFHNAIQSWQNSIKNACLLLYPLIVFCFFFASEIVTFIYGNHYRCSSIYFQIILISNLFNIYPFLPVLLALRRLKVYTIFYLLSAISIWVSEAIVIYIYPSPVAIACTSVSNTILLVIAFYFYIRYKLNISVFNREIMGLLGKVTVHSALIALFIYWGLLPLLSDFPKIVLLSVVFGSFYLLLIASGRLFQLDYSSVITPLIRSFIKNERSN